MHFIPADMPLRLVYLFILLTTVNACTFQVREPSGEEKAQITNEVLALTNEIRAAAERADADGLLQYHSETSNATHINDGTRYTKNDLLAHYRDVYTGVAKQEINIGNPSVTIFSENLALVTSQGRFTSTSKSGSRLSGDVAWTYLWQKKNGTWMLMHAHQSFPGPIARSGQ